MVGRVPTATRLDNCISVLLGDVNDCVRALNELHSMGTCIYPTTKLGRPETVGRHLMNRTNTDRAMKTNVRTPVLFEMLRSFTVLADHLSLTKAVTELGTTRQTIRRHIKELENIKQATLFDFVDRQYSLSKAGEECLASAKSVLASADSWLQGNELEVDGLMRVRFQDDDDANFFAQQHKLTKIWKSAPPLLRHGLSRWSASGAELEHRSMRKLRPYMVVYRRHADQWLCVDVGEKSSYATWLGFEWAKSAIGRSFNDDPVNSEADNFLVNAYNYVNSVGGIWYDHISTQFQRRANGAFQPVNYQRLVFSCLFPDGQPAVASVIARTNCIELNTGDQIKLPQMPKDELMEFDI